MTCTAKHTPLQPSDDEFVCPKCKAPCGDFATAVEAEGTSSECYLLHMRDKLCCYKCGYEESGNALVRRVMKARKVKSIPCPHCAGRGTLTVPITEHEGGT